MILSASHFPLTVAEPNSRILADVAAGVTSFTVRNINGFAVNNLLLMCSFGDETAEIVKTHSSTAPSGSTITLAAATRFDHTADTLVTVLPYDQVEFSHAVTSTGAKTVLATSNISADETSTGYNDLTNTTGYGFIRFKNSITGEFSGYSEAVPYAGNPTNSVEKIVMKAVKDCGNELNDDFCLEQDLIDDCNEAQEVVASTRDWSYELYKDTSTLKTVIGETEYDLSGIDLKYPNESQSMLSVRFGNRPLEAVAYSQIEDAQQWSESDYLAADATVGATSITLTNTSSFDDTGTVYLRSNGFVAYTVNDKTTNVLSGISASAITTLVPSGATVWSNTDVGEPTSCAVIDGKLVLDIPPDEDHAGINLKFRFLRKLPVLTSFASTTTMPFFNAMSYFVAARIEGRKRNFDERDKQMSMFTQEINLSMARWKLQLRRAYRVYTFNNTARSADEDDVWWN